MKIDILDLDKKAVGSIDLDKKIFGIESRKDILQRVILWQRAKARAGTHKTKGIDDVRGSTKKPFAQKGTDRARQGSNYAPHMRGGAVVFGPVVRSHDIKLQKKVRKLGLKMALSSKLKAKKLTILDVDVKTIKTKDISKRFKDKNFDSVLFIDTNKKNEVFCKSVSNIKHFDVLPVVGANVYDIMKHDNLVITKEAVSELTKRLVD
ncbi:MAG: 50S ribosomal protein L4 [Rickettsiaceae bacterium 4572_127]|nr:MAG: 50S ribosomal protein L4 [Rickettsiaceae bacterium 4572_127]